MDAWRDGEQFIVEFDLPGVVARFTRSRRRTQCAHRARQASRLESDREMVSAERPRGVFSRQLFLGETLDADQIEATYHDGVLRLTIPVAEKAKPRRIKIASSNEQTSINV